MKELVDFWKVALCISVHQTNYSRATTLPRYRTGLSLKFICFSAGSLTTIYGSVGPRNPGWHQRKVNTYHGISRATGRHLGSPAVALELRSGGGTTGMCREVKLHRVGTRTKIDKWRASIDYPNPAYSCMTDRGGIPADLSNGVGKVYNLCRV
jgi:hypothetical protein